MEKLGFNCLQSSYYSHQTQYWTACMCTMVCVCVSPVVDKEMDGSLWIQGGRKKCLVHLIDLAQQFYWRRHCTPHTIADQSLKVGWFQSVFQICMSSKMCVSQDASIFPTTDIKLWSDCMNNIAIVLSLCGYIYNTQYLQKWTYVFKNVIVYMRLFSKTYLFA